MNDDDQISVFVRQRLEQLASHAAMRRAKLMCDRLTESRPGDLLASNRCDIIISDGMSARVDHGGELTIGSCYCLLAGDELSVKWRAQ